MTFVVSFGGAHPARIERTAELTWEEYVEILSTAPESADKASRGWSCPAWFRPAYRDSENFQFRYALTLDYDHVTRADVKRIFQTYKGLRYVAYTTWSHTADRPRWRFVFPLSRPATYDEFQAVSRAVAARAGIELAARESHVPAQMMYLPTVKPGETITVRNNSTGQSVDVDGVLGEYVDWTDRRSWPHRREADGVHEHGQAVDPRTKPGLVGAFCRAYSVPAAIARFDLPYTPTENPDRWTFTAGSRPEGAIVYDEDTKLHSHHDTDPARGQNNAFDLVRLHRFGSLDTDADLDKPVTERPSWRAMVGLVSEDPTVSAETAAGEFEDLGPDPDRPEPPLGTLARPLSVVLTQPTQTRWLIRDEIERGVMALLVGPRGSYKSFKAIHWAMQVALAGSPVYVISAEGGDFGRRAEAWLRHHDIREEIPLYVVERRLDLSGKDGVELIRQDCTKLGIKPALFVLDTFSKLSGGLDENDNSAVKHFIGLLDNGLKRPPPQAFDATVLLVAHTGHSDSGRARGASALEADTDACYIVSRDPAFGTVRITRERFKSSPELPPLVYKPAVVTLDRVDDELVPVTSLVLERVTETGAPGFSSLNPPKRGPRGALQKMLLQTVGDLAPEGSAAPVGDVLFAFAQQLPHDPEGRDTRRQTAYRVLKAMVADGYVHLRDDAVSLTRVTAQPEEDWLA